MRILFSWIAFKDIFATFKMQQGHYLPLSVNDRVNHFTRVSFSRSFAKIKPSRKYPNLQYIRVEYNKTQWHVPGSPGGMFYCIQLIKNFMSLKGYRFTHLNNIFVTPATCRVWHKRVQISVCLSLKGSVLDSRLRGCWFEPYWRHCVVS